MHRLQKCIFVTGFLVYTLSIISAIGADKRLELYNYQEVEDGIKLTYYWGSETCVVIPECINGKPVRIIGQDCFSCNDSVWSIFVPETVHTIEDTAFSDCSVRQIHLPTSLKQIGTAAFSESKITSIYLPESVDSIGEFAFWECKNLRSAYIGSSITVLPKGIFADCSNLYDVFLSDTIEQISDDAFIYCRNLREIHFPLNLQTLGYGSFFGTENLNEEAKHFLKKIYETYDFEKEDEMIF